MTLSTHKWRPVKIADLQEKSGIVQQVHFNTTQLLLSLNNIILYFKYQLKSSLDQLKYSLESRLSRLTVFEIQKFKFKIDRGIRMKCLKKSPAE